MASQSVAGYNGIVYVSFDGGTTYNAIGELQDAKLKIDLKALNSTSHNSAGWGSVKAGNSNWSATLQALYVAGDTAQAGLQAAAIAKTLVYYRFDEYGTATGKPRKSGSGYITSLEVSQPNEDLEIISITVQGDGALTVTTQ